jgi:hypothetical protein
LPVSGVREDAGQLESVPGGKLLGMSSRRTWIVDRCKRLDRLLKSISPPPRDHLFFFGRLREIRALAPKNTPRALEELEHFEDTLKNARDGQGSVIMNSERHEKYLM